MTKYERVPDSQIRAGDLVAGPRGRELCGRLAGMPVWDMRHQDASSSTASLVFVAGEPATADPGAVAELPSRVDDDEGAPQLNRDDPLAGVPILADVVEDVNYWGGFPAADPLEDPAVLAEIRATADMVAAARGCQWWWSHLDRSAQRHVQWTARDDPDDVYLPPPRPGHAARMLRDGDRWAAEHEQSLHKYRRMPAGSGPGGPWWSCPFPGGFPTTRRLGSLGAVLLAGQEDGFGDTEAVLWSLAVADTARIYELDGPAAWQHLVTTYPRTATATYRHTWAWTGWDGEWRVPHWAAVARDWDGVHLTVAGYLTTAGRALPIATARTLLAGWNPDETYWLAEVVTPSGEPQNWRKDERNPLSWYRL